LQGTANINAGEERNAEQKKQELTPKARTKTAPGSWLIKGEKSNGWEEKGIYKCDIRKPPDREKYISIGSWPTIGGGGTLRPDRGQRKAKTEKREEGPKNDKPSFKLEAFSGS